MVGLMRLARANQSAARVFSARWSVFQPPFLHWFLLVGTLGVAVGVGVGVGVAVGVIVGVGVGVGVGAVEVAFPVRKIFAPPPVLSVSARSTVPG